MSLINNALKKAQHQRSGETASVPMPGGSGQRPNRNGRGMTAQTLLLITIGAAVLITASVVATVFLLGKDKPATPTTVASAPVAIEPTTAASQPAVTLATEPTIVAPTAQPEPEPVVSAIQPVIEPPVTASETTPAPVEIATHPPEPIPAPSVSLEENIYQFIDQLQVMGIRSSGADSKVLMNDRVYRVNDIVNRELDLRLISVAPDRLTFVDSRGSRYIKNF